MASSSGGNSIGVKVLSPGEDPVVDIILVHGLEGDAYKTWTAKGDKKGATEVLWARDLLPEEIPEARILSYGYDSRVATFFDAASTNMIHNHAETMVSRLYNFRARRIKGKNSVERPIIWVCHSLGGIMTKRALIYSNSCGVDSNENLRSIKVSTQAILFLGTPHMGSNLAAWGSMAHKLMSIMPGIDSKNTLVKTLETNSETLQNITSLFAGISTSFEIAFFYEELKTLIGTKHEKIVEYNSAVEVALPNTQRIGIHATHSDMCKYIDDEAPGYSDVAGMLRQYTDNAVKFTPSRWQAEKDGAVVATGAQVDKILLNHPGRILMTPAGGYSRSPSPARVSSAGPSTTKLLTRQDNDHDSTSEISIPLNVPPFIVPYQRNESPVVREWILREMDKILQNPTKLEGGNANLLLWGPSGSGKTHLVREYAFTRRSYFKGGIFWIKAKTQESRLDHFRMICSKLNLLQREEDEGVRKRPSTITPNGQEASVSVVVDWLTEHKNWLLVIDGANVDEEKEITELRQLIPGGEGGSIIFTTLNSSLQGQARLGAPEGLKLPQMSVDDAVQILFSEADMGEPTSGEEKMAQTLVESVDCLPLAVHLAAKYITERQVSIYAYAREFKEHPYVSGPGWSLTFGLTIDTLERKHPEAANLLRLVSFFGLDVPVELLMRGREKISNVRVVAREEDGMWDFNLTLKHLIAFSLVRRSHEKEAEGGREWKVDRLHFQNLITTYVRQRLGNEARTWAKHAADLFCHAFDLAEQERGEDGSIYVKDYEVFMSHGSCLIGHMHELKMEKTLTQPVRRQIHRAKEVRNKQIAAQNEGIIFTLPKRSIFGRGDMDSPITVSRKSTFESTTSSSGGTDEHRSSDSDRHSVLMIEQGPGPGVKSLQDLQVYDNSPEREWQTVGRKSSSAASSDYRPSGPSVRGSYRGQRYNPRGGKGSGRVRGRGRGDDYNTRARSEGPRYSEPPRGRSQSRYPTSPANSNLETPRRGRERTSSTVSSNYTRSTVSSSSKVSPKNSKPPSVTGSNKGTSPSGSGTSTHPTRRRPEDIMEGGAMPIMETVKTRMANGRNTSWAAVAKGEAPTRREPATAIPQSRTGPRSRDSSRNSTRYSEDTLKPNGTRSRSSSTTSPLSRGSSASGPEIMTRVVSHTYSEPAPEPQGWSPPKRPGNTQSLETMIRRIDSNGNPYYEISSARRPQRWYPPGQVSVEPAYPAHRTAGFVPATGHPTTGYGHGYYVPSDPNALSMPDGQYTISPQFGNMMTPTGFISNRELQGSGNAEPQQLSYPTGGPGIFIPILQSNNMQNFTPFPIHPASAPQMNMQTHMSPSNSHTNLTNKPRPISRDEYRALPGYEPQQHFVRRKQDFEPGHDYITRSSRSRSAERRTCAPEMEAKQSTEDAASEAIFDLESDGRQSAEALAKATQTKTETHSPTATSATPITSANWSQTSDLATIGVGSAPASLTSANWGQTSDLASIGVQFAPVSRYNTAISQDSALDAPSTDSLRAAVPRNAFADGMHSSFRGPMDMNATSSLEGALQKQDKGPLDRLSKSVQSLTATFAWRSPAETKKKLGLQK